MIKFIDLFAGIGGFHYGLSKVTRGLLQIRQYECVWSNEWDKYANQIYRKHFGECDSRDITTVRASDIPDHDLLCGGFPCQSFSIAGKRRGFNDTRGTLFFDIARILKEKQPRLCLLENVKGLLSHDNGRTFKTIISTLVELGYDLQWQVLNSKNFGVSQNRERVFIIGNLRGTPRPKVFPFGEDGRKIDELCKVREQTKISGTVTARYHKMGNADTYIKTRKLGQAMRVNSIDKPSVTLKGLGGGMGAKTGLYAVRQPLKFLQRNQKNIEGDYAFTVDGANTGGLRQGMAIRRLTPTECERLQGFPDGWTEGISDTQRYKCLGNAVTTNVITFLGEKLL